MLCRPGKAYVTYSDTDVLAGLNFAKISNGVSTRGLGCQVKCRFHDFCYTFLIEEFENYFIYFMGFTLPNFLLQEVKKLTLPIIRCCHVVDSSSVNIMWRILILFQQNQICWNSVLQSSAARLACDQMFCAINTDMFFIQKLWFKSICWTTSCFFGAPTFAVFKSASCAMHCTAK